MAVCHSNEALRAYLLARIEQQPNGCWIWRGSLDRRGYGLCWVNGRSERAARIAWECWVGPIPPGHDVHHTCPNRRCINPEHLEALPHGVHLRLHSNTGAWAGSRNSQAKVTEADAQYIKVARGLIPARDLAAQFGIGERNVYYIQSGRGWPHVGLPDFPPRTQEEVLQEAQRNVKRALNALLSLREVRLERGQTQPPNIDRYITLAKFLLGSNAGPAGEV